MAAVSTAPVIDSPQSTLTTTTTVADVAGAIFDMADDAEERFRETLDRVDEIGMPRELHRAVREFQEPGDGAFPTFDQYDDTLVAVNAMPYLEPGQEFFKLPVSFSHNGRKLRPRTWFGAAWMLWEVHMGKFAAGAFPSNRARVKAAWVIMNVIRFPEDELSGEDVATLNEFVLANEDVQGYLTALWMPVNFDALDAVRRELGLPVAKNPADTPIEFGPLYHLVLRNYSRLSDEAKSWLQEHWTRGYLANGIMTPLARIATKYAADNPTLADDIAIAAGRAVTIGILPSEALRKGVCGPLMLYLSGRVLWDLSAGDPALFSDIAVRRPDLIEQLLENPVHRAMLAGRMHMLSDKAMRGMSDEVLWDLSADNPALFSAIAIRRPGMIDQLLMNPATRPSLGARLHMLSGEAFVAVRARARALCQQGKVAPLGCAMFDRVFGR